MQNKDVYYSIPNYRQIKVRVLPSTNTRGTRIKIYEPTRFMAEPNKSVCLSYSQEIDDALEQAYNYIVDLGFKPIARCSDVEGFTILCDNWAEDFVELKK